MFYPSTLDGTMEPYGTIWNYGTMASYGCQLAAFSTPLARTQTNEVVTRALHRPAPLGYLLCCTHLLCVIV